MTADYLPAGRLTTDRSKRLINEKFAKGIPTGKEWRSVAEIPKHCGEIKISL